MILTINAGSSSLKFSLFDLADDTPIAVGLVECIGNFEQTRQSPRLQITAAGLETQVIPLDSNQVHDHASAMGAAFTVVDQQFPGHSIQAVGHRVVHGGPFFDKPTIVDDQVLQTIKELTPFAPLHQPQNLAGIVAATEAFPDAVQVACFDTSFHLGHPFVNDTFGIPHRYYEQGVRRYGFHGLSYQYIQSQLKSEYPQLHNGRVVVAHLGNGASMCAIKGGQSVDSTMAFSVLDGLPMGTRCGQLDPGVVLFLLQHEKMTPDEISHLLYNESGLKGMSGVSNDVRELDETADPQAKKALEYMAYRIRREIGAMAATLGGIDGLVFCGGVGEHHAWTRSHVCRDLGWLGISIDEAANRSSANWIATDDSIPVLIIPTNEELVIARSAKSALK